MKRILLSLLTIITLSTTLQAQSQDTTVKVSDQFNFIQLNMNKCHKEYTTGINFLGTGIFVQIFDIGISSMLNDNSATSIYNVHYTIGGTRLSNSILLLGTALDVTGVILMIDSHRYLGRIGVGIGSCGLKINYTL